MIVCPVCVCNLKSKYVSSVVHVCVASCLVCGDEAGIPKIQICN